MSDDYWNSSSTSKFNFDDEDLSSSQIDSVANDVFSSNNETADTFDIEFIISKRNLEMLLQDLEIQSVYVVPPVDETINKMIHGHRFVLEVYKSYQDKILLLDGALKTNNGDIILRVTDFLRRTLKFNIFSNVLMKRKVVLVQYCNYLKKQGNIEELENLYMATGFVSNIRDLYCLNRRENANKEATLNKLKCFISSHSEYLNIFNEKKLIGDYLKFLEWQFMKKEERKSVIEQLASYCEKQFGEPHNEDVVYKFKVLFKIDDAQFEWTVMNCLCYMSSWKMLISVFVKSNWLTKRNVLKTALNTEQFILGVSRHNPPKNVLEHLMTCLNDSERSLALAEKLQCHKFMIECFISQRDRLGLLNCMGKVMANSEEYFIIKKALEAPDKKWKN